MQQAGAQIQGAGSNQKLITRSGLFFYAVSLFIFVFAIVYFSEIRRGFTMLVKLNSYWLILALVLQLCTYLFNAFIYRMLAGLYRLSNLPSLGEFYKASVILLFFNQTIPSAGISGNAFLFNYLKRRNMLPVSILSLLLLELLSFYAAIEIVILFLGAVVSFKDWPSVFVSVLLAGLLVYFLFGFFVVIAGRKKTFHILQKKFGERRWYKLLFRKMHFSLEEANADYNTLELGSLVKSSVRTVALVLLFQLLLFATDCFTLIALFHGLAVPISVLSVLLALICTKIISVLPFSPGSLILFESGMTFFFVKLGVLLGSAVAVTLIFRLLSFWLPIPAGLFLYRRWLRGNDKKNSNGLVRLQKPVRTK